MLVLVSSVDEHQADAFPRIAGVEIALDPVVGRSAAELLERLRVLRFGPIELGALPEHGVDAACLRAVRILGRLDLRVVLAVDGDPLLGHHAGREPEPEPEEMADRRMQIERAVRLRAVQEDRHAGDRHVRHRQREDDVAPPGKRHQAVRGEVEKAEWHSNPSYRSGRCAATFIYRGCDYT